jgi:hypothetical protein
MPQTIREANRDLQFLALEIAILRQHNIAESIRMVQAGMGKMSDGQRAAVLQDLQRRFVEIPHDALAAQPERLLPTAEACAVLVWLERVLRIVLGKTGPQHVNVTLPRLLSEATGKRQLLFFPEKYEPYEISLGIVTFRNGVLHGNLEAMSTLTTNDFYGGEYVRLIEELYDITNYFAEQLRQR